MTLQVVNLTNNANQQYSLVGENNIVVQFELIFQPTQNGWVFNVSYAGTNYELNGALLTVSPNFLRNYRNVIPFGMSCISTDGYEPQFLNDFVDSRVSIYLLSAAEVAEVEAEYYS